MATVAGGSGTDLGTATTGTDLGTATTGTDLGTATTGTDLGTATTGADLGTAGATTTTDTSGTAGATTTTDTSLTGGTPTTGLATVTSGTGALGDTTPGATTTAAVDTTPTTGSSTDLTPSADTTPSADATLAPSTGPAASEWNAVFEKMRTLTSFHESGVITTENSSNVNLEADMVPPSSQHITVTTSLSGTNSSTEIITIGQDTWTKTGGAGLDTGWQKSPTSIPMGVMFDVNSANGFQNVTNAGDDTIDGTAATRYTFESSTSDTTGTSGASSNATGEAWVAKDSGYLLRIHLTSNAAAAGQAGSGDILFNFSRFNDPTIKIEAPTTTP